MKKYYSTLIFFIVLASVSVFYSYHEIAFMRPQSVHRWRQSDCASLALNYYQDGMKFFNTETHNLTSDGGTTGKCSTSEIPVLYYSVAALYKVFGYHEYVYRIFNMLLFFLGLFYLFRLLKYLIKDDFWAVVLSLLFFTSPVLVYYGNNFLSNTPALAFSIIGWYYFIRFYTERKEKYFLISAFVFLFAAAFKVTALFSVFALFGIYLLELAGLKLSPGKDKLFSRPVVYLLPFFFIFTVIGLWLIYAHNYNQSHDCYYFSTTIFPIWELDREVITRIVENIRKGMLFQYFNRTVLIFVSLCFLFLITFFRKSNRLLLLSVFTILTESIVYILLQFMTFEDHDYYVIDMYILPVVIIAAAFELLQREFPKIYRSVLFKGGFLALLVFNTFYARQELNARYKGWRNDDYANKKDIYSITPYLREIGITSKDTVISIPDVSNATLYLMNQKGWTEYTDPKFGRGEKVRYNQDSAGIQASIDKGAKYLIVNGIKELYSKPYLKGFCTSLAGKYKGVLIFNLKDGVKNYELPVRMIKKKYFCSAEGISDDGKWYISAPDSNLFEYANNQSNEIVRSGKYSCRLDSKSPYGMTIRLKDLQFGESFAISVWRKMVGKAKGGMVASSAPSPYYNGDYRIIEKDPVGWEKLLIEFYVPAEISGQELTVYVHTPDEGPVYFDDFEVIHYEN